MQSESSSCITGVCVVFVYSLFTKGTHHITEVTTVCLKRASAGALFHEGKGDVANLLCLILVAVGFFFFSIAFFFWGVTNMFPETLLFTAVGWFNGSYFLWDCRLFVCLSGCAGSQGCQGSVPPPCRAASASPPHSWSLG